MNRSNRKKQMLFLGSVLCLGMALSSCATHDEMTVDKKIVQENGMDHASVVTMGSPRLDASKPSTISWSGRIEVLGDVSDEDRARLQALVTTLCEQYINQKGYTVVSGEGDFQLSAIVSVEQSNTSALLLKKAGIDPGIAGSPVGQNAAGQQRGKGSLLLELKQGRTSRWKGAVQMYTDSTMDPALRQQRVARAVAQLIATWP